MKCIILFLVAFLININVAVIAETANYSGYEYGKPISNKQMIQLNKRVFAELQKFNTAATNKSLAINNNLYAAAQQKGINKSKLDNMIKVIITEVSKREALELIDVIGVDKANEVLKLKNGEILSTLGNSRNRVILSQEQFNKMGSLNEFAIDMIGNGIKDYIGSR